MCSPLPKRTLAPKGERRHVKNHSLKLNEFSCLSACLSACLEARGRESASLEAKQDKCKCLPFQGERGPVPQSAFSAKEGLFLLPSSFLPVLKQEKWLPRRLERGRGVIPQCKEKCLKCKRERSGERGRVPQSALFPQRAFTLSSLCLERGPLAL